MMVLTQRDLTGRTKTGKEESSAGGCQAGPRMLQSPSLLTFFPGGSVGREVERVQWVSPRVIAAPAGGGARGGETGIC